MRTEKAKPPKKHGNGKYSSAPIEYDQRKLTAQRLAVFILSLKEHGIVSRAARDASPHAKGNCSRTFLDRKLIDKEFSDAWDAAIEEADSKILSELRRRAVEGWDVPVFQKGKRVRDVGGTPASIRTYSDRLLEQLAKSRRKIEGHEFTDHKHLTVDVNHSVDGGRVYIMENDLNLLSTDDKLALVNVLAKIAHNRGEVLKLEDQTPPQPELAKTALEHVAAFERDMNATEIEAGPEKKEFELIAVSPERTEVE